MYIVAWLAEMYPYLQAWCTHVHSHACLEALHMHALVRERQHIDQRMNYM